jgi:hypothetical protein
MSETRILIRLLQMYFHRTGNSAQLCQNFGISGGGGFKYPKHPLGTPLIIHNFVFEIISFEFNNRY